jgi:O-antigen ligase
MMIMMDDLSCKHSHKVMSSRDSSERRNIDRSMDPADETRNSASRMTKVIKFFLYGCLFCIPLSPSLKSICVNAAALCILASSEHRQKFGVIIRQYWCQATIIFFIFTLLACLWSPSHHPMVIVFKYLKLLYLPILVLGFQDAKTRENGINIFILAMVITAILSCLKCLHYLHIKSDDPGAIFHNHIITGFMMAFAAYLAGMRVITTLRKPSTTLGMRCLPTLGMALAFIITSCQILFIGTGRVGLVLYFLLLILLAIQFAQPKIAILFIILIALGLGAATFVKTQNNAISWGMAKMTYDLRELKQGNKNTSLGFRLMFHTYAKKLFLQSPIYGHGTGSFAYLFKKDDPVPSWTAPNLLDPHSQYWLILSEYGILGMLLLLNIFLSLFLVCRKLKTMRPVLLGLLIGFIISNITDSLLLYSAVGYLFVVFTALAVSEKYVL